MWYVFIQTRHSHQTVQEWPLSERSEHIKQAAVDQQREQNWHQHLQEQKQQHKCCTKWEFYKLSAQRHMLIQHLHNDCCCCCCCCWACHMRVSTDILNQERFHIQKVSVKKLKKKERKKSYVRWESYNSLHWQINSSELLKKITQAMKKFSSANLICTKQANMCQQTLTIIWQPFQKLKAQPWRKKKDDVISWTHIKVLWSSCLLRS